MKGHDAMIPSPIFRVYSNNEKFKSDKSSQIRHTVKDSLVYLQRSVCRNAWEIYAQRWRLPVLCAWMKETKIFGLKKTCDTIMER
ncbi:hypothetical protein IF2G_00258 [Cordyceps javanica]|nr:hypothetical protein IF2G_00258 [Cordyceps javanica]